MTGYETGYETGYSEGDAEGYGSGLTEGHEAGEEEGYALGYSEGHEEGEGVGYQEGREEGHDSGEKTGYEVGKEEGHASGYAGGFEEGIGDDYLLRNPTYSEVVLMLGQSGASSAWEINNEFEDGGIRTGYVSVEIMEGGAYTLVAFETVDRGLVVMSSASQKEVQLEVGRRYSELLGWSTPDWDETITRITVVW